MEREIKTPSYYLAYFRWFLEAFLTCAALELIQTCRTKKTSTDFIKALCNSQVLLPSVPTRQTIHQHSMVAIKADLRDLHCSLLPLLLCMKIHIIKPNFFNSRNFTLIISNFNFLYNTTLNLWNLLWNTEHPLIRSERRGHLQHSYTCTQTSPSKPRIKYLQAWESTSQKKDHLPRKAKDLTASKLSLSCTHIFLWNASADI